MDSILASFHLEPETFRGLLQATGGIVAGSAALAAYLPNTFTPNDLDIWVPSDSYAQSATAEDLDSALVVRKTQLYLFRYFFQTHGYEEVTCLAQSDAEYTSNPVFAILRSIQRFQHPTSGHSIQVIHCKVPVEQVLETFDLSVAKTWWDPLLNNGTLHTHDPVATQRKEMYSLRESTTDRETMRIRKYITRGFTFLPNATDTARLDALAAVCTMELLGKADNCENPPT